MMQRKSEFPVEAIKVSSDKYSRACATTPLYEQGGVHLLFGAWNGMFINQHVDFNAHLDTPDDIVDAGSQLLNYFKDSDVSKPQIITRKVNRRSKVLQGY